MESPFPPFEPDPAEPRPRRFRPVPLRVLAPNLVTLMALCLGLTAIRLAIEGKLDLAVYAVLAAAVLDGVDGRLARALKGTSRFGAELDSLSDFVSFGVVPALILYFHALKELRSLGWIVALVFAVALVLRLARFNVSLDAPERPDWQQDYHTGVPAPAAALTALLPVYLHLMGLQPFPGEAAVTAAYVLGIAFLAVSRLPTFSGKRSGARVPREGVLPLFVAVVLVAGLLLSFPVETLAVGSLAYLASIPLGWLRYRRLERARGAPSPAVPAIGSAPVHLDPAAPQA